jgi:hypothetical protein
MSILTRYQQVKSADAALIAGLYRILTVNEPPSGTRLQIPTMYDQD